MTELAPAHQHYPKDFLAETFHMTPEQTGIYIWLRGHCWMYGSIPNDMPTLARSCKVTPLKMARAWCTMQHLFSASGGVFLHSAVEILRQTQAKHRELSKTGGEKSGAIRRAKSIGDNTGNEGYFNPPSTEREPNANRNPTLPSAFCLLQESKPIPPVGGEHSNEATPPDNPSVVRPPVQAKSEAALHAETCISTAAAAIHARHPAGPRRDISAKAVANALSKIVRHKQATIRQVPELVAEIDRVHATMCATEDWRKDGGMYAKGLENWLCPSKGRYEIAAVVAIRQPIKPTVYFDDSYLTRVEEA